MVKVRLQADGRLKALGKEPRYKGMYDGCACPSLPPLPPTPSSLLHPPPPAPAPAGTLDAFARIPREEGFGGFFRGLGPSVQRAAVINGCGIASYDHTKQMTMKLTGGVESGLLSQVVGSLVSGLISALVSTPFDVVKTRIMNQPKESRLYSGPLDCAVKTVRAEGVLALYKGFTPAYTRLAPWQLVFFLVFERVNKLVVGENL